MKSEGLAKHLLAAFVLAALAYMLSYNWIEHRRTAKGPWELTFSTNASGEPQVAIFQARLEITNRLMVFPGQRVPETFKGEPIRLRFDKARSVPFEVPFGQCVFQDATFLPGSVTFRFFGHEIELLPRVMIVDHEEKPWGGTWPLRAGERQER